MCDQDVHVKKKLKTPKSEPATELTYNYLLSLFVTNFNYSTTDFDLLTPVQAFQVLETKSEQDKNKFEAWRNELRTVSFYIIKSAMGDTSHINSPRDLYPLEIDKHYEELESEKYKSLEYDDEFANWTKDYLAKQS